MKNKRFNLFLKIGICLIYIFFTRDCFPAQGAFANINIVDIPLKESLNMISIIVLFSIFIPLIFLIEEFSYIMSCVCMVASGTALFVPLFNDVENPSTWFLSMLLLFFFSYLAFSTFSLNRKEA